MGSSAGGSVDDRAGGGLTSMSGPSPWEALNSLLGLDLAGLFVDVVELPMPAGLYRTCSLASVIGWAATRGLAVAAEAWARCHFGIAFFSMTGKKAIS